MPQSVSPELQTSPIVKWVVPLVTGLFAAMCIGWVLDMPQYLGFAFFKEQLLAPVVGLSLVTVFLKMPANRGQRGRLPWYDTVAAVAAVAVTGHVMIAYPRLVDDVALRTTETLVIGVVTVALVLEGLRRAAGHVLFFIVSAFIVYGLIGHLIPGQLTARAVDIDWLFIYLAFDPSGLFGTPMTVGATIVLLFILMGQYLISAGGGEFFTDLAMATMGRRRGGAAKIAIVASAMFGSISGSAVSNVASTGIITIPLMRRSGYSPADAGAIESVASTGGQFMPPIMGAAAFLMAEFLEIPYAEVMLAALVPSLLYYFAVFIQVDLIAARDGITQVELDIPGAWDVLKRGWHFVVPFVVLLYALFELNVEPSVAALYATAVIVVGGLLRSYRGQQLGAKKLVSTLSSTGLVMVELTMILGGAGFVIATLNVTGLGFGLTLSLVQLADGSLLLLLLLAGGVCIVLGMGMPTAGVYVLLAALVAPSLVKFDVLPLAAHMFILYFGMMSMITPPIALAAFAAATISGASPMTTGWASVRLGWVAYTVPFLFVLSPTLLLFGEPHDIALNVATATVGVYFVSVATVGYFSRPLVPAVRVVLAVAGLAAMFPDKLLRTGGMIDATGVAVGVLMLAYLARAHRRDHSDDDAGK